jgi:hypothetical protein
MCTMGETQVADSTQSALEQLTGPLQWVHGPNPSSCKRSLFEFLEGGVWTLVTTFFTFWALFAPDLIQVLIPKDADKVLAVITLIGFVVFFSDIIFNFVVRRDYGGKPGLEKLTWFLLIDIVGTLSLVPDFLPLFDVYMEKSQSAGLARAGRAARIGARLSRLVRMFRMSNQKEELGPDGTPIEMKASNIGTSIADKISTRVVLLVMLLITLLPVFTYSPAATQSELAAEIFYGLYPAAATIADLREFATFYNKCDFDRCARTEELVYMQVEDGAFVDVRTHPTTGAALAEYDEFRKETEFEDMIVTRCEDGSSELFTAETYAAIEDKPACPHIYYMLTFMIKARLIKQSVMSLFFMLFAVLIIGLGASGFLSDVQDYVITPIERMTGSMNNLKRVLTFLNLESEKIDEEGGSEMDVLGNSIEKMISLLNIGFGEAGTQIIETNCPGSPEAFMWPQRSPQ